jgi:hypothetical protein
LEGRFEQKKVVQDHCSTRNIPSLWKCGKGFFNTFFSHIFRIFSMKRFLNTTAIKAVLVGVVVSGMATACQNGDGAIGGFIAKDDQAAASAKTGGAATQSDEDRKAEQARKIAEFLAKPEVKEMSAGLEEIAQAVAVAVEDKALTERIYEKCMEKFDGETNTLWMHLEADSKVKAQGGWSKRVDAELSKGRKNATVKGIGNIDAAVKKFEKTIGAPLHLFWMYPSAWDKKTTPLVTFVPWDKDPATLTSVMAFDSKGNTFELNRDYALAKKRPVIIITINERTNVNGQKKAIGFAMSHEQTSGNGTYNIPSSKINPKGGGAQVQAIRQQQVEQVTIEYPYNQDEFGGGGVEFFTAFLLTGNYDDNNQVATSSNSGMLPGEELTNANYTFSFGANPIVYTFNTTLAGRTVTFNNFDCEYYEADGAFFLDDFIAAHRIKPLSTVSRTYIGSSTSGQWPFVANGGTVSATYRLLD